MLHICNTFFERELETGAVKPLSSWMRSHPAVLQLQFLPLLYAGPEDRILVSDLPENPDPRLCLIDEHPKTGCIKHWGPSLAIAEWTKSAPPDWGRIRAINSKVFSFTESPKLPGAELLYSESDVHRWIAAIPGAKVLKTPFGTAGGGHFHIGKGDLGAFLKKQSWPLIGEPWVERLFDFSTQWKNGRLLGVTGFENESNGTYRKTTLDPVEPWALEEHLAVAKPLVEKLQYADHLGVDAYAYRWNGEIKLQPVVEINGRKTMSWVALQMKKPISYSRSEKGLLPSQLKVGNKTIHFTRNLISC